jgi:transcriptional antiterminator Rof (Rho-off)
MKFDQQNTDVAVIASSDTAVSDTDDYQSVACSFYDELGLRMMRGTPCRLVVKTDGGRETVEATIDDPYTEGDGEYVRLGDGTTIRLDRIVEVDDVER